MNFTLFWYLIGKDFMVVNNEESGWYAAILVITTVAATAMPINYYRSLSEALGQAVFQVVSITITTGTLPMISVNGPEQLSPSY